MNLVFGGATSHWATGSTWIMLAGFSQTIRVVKTHDDLWNFEVDGDLGDRPHAHSRVQEKAIAVDSPQNANNGNTVPDRAVVFDPAERGYVLLAKRGVLVNDARQGIPGLPMRHISEA